MEARFRVWCEFEVNGEKHTSMESEASWFLLTQTGKLWSYGPVHPPQPLSSEYGKAIPLFYTGFKDKDGVEIFEGDIVEDYLYKSKHKIVWLKTAGRWDLEPFGSKMLHPNNLVVIGNIYENLDLLEKEAK